MARRRMLGSGAAARGNTLAWLALASLVLADAASAQRRGAEQAVAPIEITFGQPFRVGDTVIDARTYRVSVSSRGISLYDPATMVAVATLPATETQTQQVQDPPTAILRMRKDRGLELVVRVQTQQYVAVGVMADKAAPGPKVELASRGDAQLGEVLPEQKAAMDLILESLNKRHVKDVLPCADKGQKGRWGTDDKRFVSCVCPIAARWRLPAAKPPLRVHVTLAKGKSGLALSVDEKGKVTDCRVWVGAEPPTGEVAGPLSTATATATPAAPAGAPAPTAPAAASAPVAKEGG